MRADGQRGARSVIELQLAVAELMLGRPPKPKPLFGPDDLHEFAVGDVSRCLGPAFAVSRGNRLPRIPNGDLLLMSRVLDIEGRPAGLAASGKLSSEFDVTPNAWFYRGVRVGGGDRATDTLFPALPPYAVLMEMALQPCGFLSAYLGSPLQNPRANLYFRNLDGQGQVLRELDLRGRTVRDDVCLVSSTRSQGIILQKFTFALFCDGEPFYKGWASFGYFPEGALRRQVGLDNGATAENGATAQDQDLSHFPASPLAARELPALLLGTESTVPQLHLLEEVGVIPAGGNNGVGYLRARGRISPQDWYFQAHFYEDPVMPGSLGVEAVMQAMRAYGRAQYPAFSDTAVHQVPGRRFEWRYRGQVTPDDRAWWLDVHLSDVVRDGTSLVLVGDASVWKGQLRIYEMHNVAVQLDRDVTGVAC